MAKTKKIADAGAALKGTTMIDHDNEDHEHARAAEHHAACASNPGMAGEDHDAILTASEASVDTELRRLGVDPVAVGERGEAFAKMAAENARLRADYAAIADATGRYYEADGHGRMPADVKHQVERIQELTALEGEQYELLVMPERYRPKSPEAALGYLTEECGEVLAAVGKTLRWGLESVNPDLASEHQETNRDWILRELRDLKRAIAIAEGSLALAKVHP